MHTERTAFYTYHASGQLPVLGMSRVAESALRCSTFAKEDSYYIVCADVAVGTLAGCTHYEQPAVLYPVPGTYTPQSKTTWACLQVSYLTNFLHFDMPRHFEDGRGDSFQTLFRS